MIRKKEYEHNGIKFTMFECMEARGESADLDGKKHLDGKGSITLALNQYKYGDEVIFQVYADPGSMIKKKRVNSNYDRIQIFIKKSIFMYMLEEINKEISNA